MTTDEPYLIPDESDLNLMDDEPDVDDLDPLEFEELLDSIDEEQLSSFFEASRTTASKPKGISPEFLSKIWHINVKDAKRTLEVTTQFVKRSTDPTLSRNYSTNDRML